METCSQKATVDVVKTSTMFQFEKSSAKNELCPPLLTFKMEGEDPEAMKQQQASRSKKKATEWILLESPGM